MKSILKFYNSKCILKEEIYIRQRYVFMQIEG